MTRIRKSHDDYTLGWLTALPLERSAAEAVLDETHEPLRGSPGDGNTYTLGEIQGHNVVITCLPSGQYGIATAAHATSRMRISFPNIQYGLLVGIAGGVPDSSHADIRLGDIIVGQPTSTHPAVVQYDFGKSVNGKFQRIGTLNPPPSVLLSALSKLQANHKNKRSRVAEFLQKLGECNELFRHPGQEQDRLFSPLYNHKEDARTCADCDQTQVITRPKRSSTDPVVHYGVIGTGNQVIKDTQMRQRLEQQEQLLCFEMEAAGMVNEIPSLIIRGICDYSDTHKNKHWQEYAAAAAAAYAKDFLSILSPYAYIGTRFKLTMNLSGVPAICNFVGRNADLEKLARLLLPNASTSQKIVTLHGLSGIGKTQLALRFIQCHKEDFTAVFWVNAHTRENIVQSLASVHLPQSTDAPASDHPAHDEELEGKAMSVISWLSLRENTKWLLVFDGMALDSTEVQKFFPKSDQGSILLTTQFANTQEYGHPYRLSTLNFDDSLKLLTLKTGLTISDNIPSDIYDLLNQLDGHPLAITLAGSFISETGATVSECLQQYSSLWHRHESQIPECDLPFSRNISTAWMLPFEEIKKSRPIIFKMLLLLSCFDQRDIWPELIKTGLRVGDPPSWYTSVASSNDEFYQVMGYLLRLGLLDRRPSQNSYFMHPVVQNWCQGYLAQYDKNELVSIALGSIGLCVPEKDDSEAWKWQKRIIPHADRIYQLSQGDLAMQPCLGLADASRRLGDLFLQYGKLQEAEVMYKTAHDWCQKLDPLSRELLVALDSLGLVYRNQSKYKEAEEIHEKVLAVKQNRVGPEDPSTLDTTHHLAELYSSQGMLEKAKKMYERVLSGRTSMLGQSHPSTLSTMDKLGTVYLGLGELNDAMDYCQRAYQGYRKHRLITAMMNITNNIGLIYLKQGRFVDAAAYHTQVVKELEAILGDNHPSVFNAMENLGLLYTKQGKFDEAKKHLFEALSHRKRVLGAEHPSIITTKDNIARLYVSQGKTDDAEREYKEALELANRTLSSNHTSALRLLNNLGNLYYSQGMFREAENNYLQAMAGYEAVLVPTHTSRLSVMVNLGNIYKLQDKRDEAGQMYRGALDGYKATVGESHPTTLKVENNLGLLYFDQGNFQASEKMLVQCKKKKEELFGSDHPSTLGAIDNLGFLRYCQGRFKEADELMEQSLTGWQKIGHRQHILATQINRGMVWIGLGRFDEAEEILKQSQVQAQELLDPDHPFIAEVTHNLGVLSLERGAIHEAKKQLQYALDKRGKIFGANHTSTLETSLSLANCLRTAGDLSQANAKYIEITNSLKANVGPNHPSTLQAQCHFVALLLDEDSATSITQAETIITPTLIGLQSTFGWDHLFTARAIVQMARLQTKKGHLREAKKLYSKAYQSFESTLGEEHRETVSARKMLHTASSQVSQMYRRLILVASVPLLVGICVRLAKKILNRSTFVDGLLRRVFALMRIRKQRERR
ncbi:hypothetical protein AnigIFM50267_010283 [Aspergillus niger]|nr:hypothetical protein AnigIFM50267_010283 [Aspergillus niger]